MVTTVNNADELAKAIKNDADTIEIHGNLANRTVKIKATGKIAWAAAFGLICIGMTATVLTAGSGGATSPVTAPTAAVSYLIAPTITATTLGAGGVIAVSSLILAAGSIGASKFLFKKLRNNYEITQKRNNYVVLKRK